MRLLPERERKDFADAVEKYRDEVKDRISPAEQGEKFEVPRLMSDIQGTLEFADTDIFMEYHDWSLINYSPKMDEGEFTIRETARSFEIDIEGKRVTYQFASEDEQLILDIAAEGLDPRGTCPVARPAGATGRYSPERIAQMVARTD